MRWSSYYPGLAIGVAGFAAALQASSLTGGPSLLYALLIGLALNFLAGDMRCKPGVDFASRHVLRWGVALLGARVSAGEMAALGWKVCALVVLAVLSTLIVSLLIARLAGRPASEGLLTGGAVSICGASAALAISSVLPSTRQHQRLSVAVIAGVTVLSTIAMVAYPALARLLGFDDSRAGIFIGGTIHDVAQVVGAGFSLSTQTGQVATIVKLMRISCLLPVVLFARAVAGESAAKIGAPLVPRFMLTFIALAALNTLDLLPPFVQSLTQEGSRLCFGVAIVGLGLKTTLSELRTVGWVPGFMLLGETVWIAVIVGLLLWL